MWKLWVAVGLLLVAVVGIIVVSSPDTPNTETNEGKPEMVATPMDETPPSPAVPLPLPPVKQREKDPGTAQVMQDTNPLALLSRSTQDCKRIEMELKRKGPDAAPEIVAKFPNYITKQRMTMIAGCKMVETGNKAWLTLLDNYEGEKKDNKLITFFRSYIGIPMRAYYVEKLNRETLQQRLVAEDLADKDQILAGFDALSAPTVEECVTFFPPRPEARTLCQWFHDIYSVNADSLDPEIRQIYWGIRAIVESNTSYLAKVDKEPLATLIRVTVSPTPICDQVIDEVIEAECKHF